MVGVKGAKPRTVFSIAQRKQIINLVETEQSVVVTEEQLALLNIGHCTYTGRAKRSDLPFKFGVRFEHLTDETPGKRWVGFICEVCTKHTTMLALKIRLRTYTELRSHPLCGRCYVSSVVKTSAWRAKNATAQLIAQKRPDVIKKHRQNTRAMWADPTSAIRNSQSQPNHGHYLGLRYDSLTELSYIMFTQDSGRKITRFKGKGIEYTYEDKIRLYVPDFIIDDTCIVEVKGRHRNFNEAIVNAKFEALKQFSKLTGMSEPELIWDHVIPRQYRGKAYEYHHAKIT
jgi:hypothetical protein